MVFIQNQEDELPRRFGEFLLFDKIGQGGMADIFLAKSLGTLGQQRLSVIKRVRPLLSADPQFADMLIDEAKLCAILNHKNVVQVTDLGRVEKQLYIAMEYVEGFDLNDLLRRCTKTQTSMPAEFVFLIIEETLSALDFAHRATDQQGLPLEIIHRDVSPTNVLISCEGEVKLCDFGIARATARQGALPDAALKGKFAYMSPEHANGGQVDSRSDIYAVGILLWEMISGRRLYRGNANEVLSQAQSAEVTELPDRGLPNYEEIKSIVGKALSKNPDDRYQTAQEMLGYVGGYVQEASLFASQLKFARFLRENFGDDLQRQRREREKASTLMTASMVPPSPFEDSLVVKAEPKNQRSTIDPSGLDTQPPNQPPPDVPELEDTEPKMPRFDPSSLHNPSLVALIKTPRIWIFLLLLGFLLLILASSVYFLTS